MITFRLFTLIACLSIFSVVSNAQLKYYDAAAFPLFGKISEETETRYERLPAHLQSKTRPPVWRLGKDTAGLFIRFSSNSSSIGLKWTLVGNNILNHMTNVGVKGFDLYCLQGDKWEFVNSARTLIDGFENHAIIVANMSAEGREFMLYFPLYDGVTSLEIGVDSTAFLHLPKREVFTQRKPIITYGTSILQGACASRPGMAHTSILSRWLDTEFINLGFSGNGQLDYEIAEIIAEREVSLIILDFMPNVNVTQIEEKMEKFYDIIRQKQPDVTILFIENPIFPQGRFDLRMRNEVETKNAALHKAFAKLLCKGEQNTFLIPSAGMIGIDGEATVDGVHFTDLGFMRYAEYLYPIVKQHLDE
ncbi:MAG: SGNH/GDSL hydrolase family protein [Dysgonamonadaceae bacterium]|jgi:lysophospholipase L1-like esterase|nr:SGNH/GDSL hydrolase family protein [Dysgonamonadaceae bacterium]